MSRQPEPEPMDIAEEASAYVRADFADVNSAFVERLAGEPGLGDNVLALDLGTGPGDIPIRVLRARPRWRVAAADLSRPMLAHARDAVRAAGLDEAIDLVCMDAKEAPFPSASFDVIFSNSILHHLSDMAPFLAEVKRVARPGAFVLLRDLARPATPAAAAAMVRQYAADEPALLQEEFYRSFLAAYTPDEVRAQLVLAGLTGLRVGMVSDRHLDVFGRIVR